MKSVVCRQRRPRAMELVQGADGLSDVLSRLALVETRLKEAETKLEGDVSDADSCASEDIYNKDATRKERVYSLDVLSEKCRDLEAGGHRGKVTVIYYNSVGPASM